MLLGRGATFSVVASGTAPLLYQWYRNGAAIGGTNAASYTTPVVTQADNNTTYSVTISNSAGSVSSSTVALLTGPRAPAVGDWRYLQWEQAPAGSTIQAGEVFILGTSITSAPGALVDPLKMGEATSPPIQSGGAYGCFWSGILYGLSPSLSNVTGGYNQGNLVNNSPNQFLQSMDTGNTIIFSMDVQPLCEVVGIAYEQIGGTSGFDQRIETVAPGSLQTQVSADGAQSRIVTAVSFNDATGQIVLLSYGWQGDTTTAYEAKTIVDQPANILADAESLANAGYFISAFGGNDHDGDILVGMRVMGDSTPRPYSAFFSIGDTSQPTQYGNQPKYPIPLLPTVTDWNFFESANQAANDDGNFAEQ